MLAVMSRRLRQLAGLVEDLSLKEVPARLAAYLLYQSERQEGRAEFELEIAKGQLASLLGTIPETLSRILAKPGERKPYPERRRPDHHPGQGRAAGTRGGGEAVVTCLKTVSVSSEQ